jgi:hypothetical protein
MENNNLKMLKSKHSYYNDINDNANSIANDFTNGNKITLKVLEAIIEMYKSAKVEQSFKDEYFDTAYHPPITGELEFFIARILYHYSNLKNKKWKILLRKQENKTAPDIRLLKNDKTFAIIEIKAKAGWIQPFLSPERYQNDKIQLQGRDVVYNPDNLIATLNKQLTKYFGTFNISNNDVFFFLPTLALVHRKKYVTELPGYYEYFATTSGLPKENLILLSGNRRLDLSFNPVDLEPTDNFEKMMNKLAAS